MRLFQVRKLPDWVIDEIAPYHNNLPETDHLDGKYRLRRYSVVAPITEGHLMPLGYGRLSTNEFTQSSEYNKFQGDVKRVFEPLEESFVRSKAFTFICNLFNKEFNWQGNIEVHQMRVLAKEGGKLSPEGIHQDGFDNISMVGVSRKNMTGGHLLLYRDRQSEPIVDMILRDGESVYLDDRELWHNGSPVVAVDPDSETYMDMLILLAKR